MRTSLTLLSLSVGLLASGCATARFKPAADRGFTTASAEGRSYEIYRPAGWTPEKRWPVIIYLHGGGERGTDGILPTQVGIGPAVWRSNGSFPFVVAFPQADRPWGMPEMEARVLEARERMIRDHAGDPDRVYLTGNSMGGFGTWIIGARHPELFAALVPICGGVRPPRGVKVPADSIARQPDPEGAVARKLGSLPVWAFHGGRDWMNPPRSSRRLVEALRAAGGDVRYTEYADLGHNSWDRAYAETALYEWMLRQRNSPTPAATALALP
jgi:predicted peptidase